MENQNRYYVHWVTGENAVSDLGFEEFDFLADAQKFIAKLVEDSSASYDLILGQRIESKP